jgi:hypothetical protein
LPVAPQVDCPELHDVVPVWQTFGGVPGVHARLAVHATQEPSAQTRFVPHEVPSGTLPVSEQVDCPELHDVAPVRQMLGGVPGMHATPEVQAIQAPAMHADPVGHATPAFAP